MTSAVLFQISPYAAIIIFTGGMVVRYLMMRKGPPGRAPSLHHKGTLSSGVRFLEVSLFPLLLGHIGGLLFPQWLIQWNSAAVRLYMLEALAFGFGILALVGWALAMWHHLSRSDGSIASQAADAVFLSLLFTMLFSGTLIAVLFRWGSSWGTLTLTPYALSLLRGRPAVDLIADMPFLVQLHVFSAFATVALLPVTRIAPILAAGFSRAVQVMSTLVRGSIEPFRRPLETLVQRLNLTSRIWPEED